METLRITLIEVMLREGLQSIDPVSTQAKIQLARALREAGVKHIQATAFVHPKTVPQMADAEDVIHELRRIGTFCSALVLNQKGLERALTAGTEQVDLSISASDTHSKRNTGKGAKEALTELKHMIHTAKAADVNVRVGIQCAFGCGYEGAIAESHIVSLLEDLAAYDVDFFSLADSTGDATPLTIRSVLSRVLTLGLSKPLILHLHDTRGRGLANMHAALEQGVTHFDTSLGGLGGCPFIPNARGNIATEDACDFLHAMGYDTGISWPQLVKTTEILRTLSTQDLPSYTSSLSTICLSGESHAGHSH